VPESQRSIDIRLRAAVESAPSGLLMVDAQGRIVLVNRMIEELFGYSREELLGRPLELLIPERFRQGHPGFRAGFLADPRMRRMGAGRDLYGRRKDGSEIPLEIGLTPVATDEGMFVLSSVVDISARKQAEAARSELEAQLRHAQKLEALGTLAGGVAHEFNNVLQGIVGYAELLNPELPRGSRAEADLREVLRMAERGQEVVQRILAFSRRQEQARKPQDLARAVQQAVKLLRNTLPPSVEIRINGERAGPTVMADTTALHQILMNLANNAAQAMPGGGVLDVGVERQFVRDSFVRAHPELREGWYGVIVVTDTGAGMSEDVRERAFEPFFTTKPPGAGTGLGLSMVHGLVREHGGVVLLESAPGQGTTVRCYFPELETEGEGSMAFDSDIPRGNGERILVLDDEPRIAGFMERWLDDLGYAVKVETRPEAALQLLGEAPDDWDLVMTDYLMPGMTGLEFAARVRELNPTVPIVLTTGFVDDIPEEAIRAAGVGKVLRKPVFMKALAEALRELLA
jgi:PAS domain S-box-containing protein